MLSVRGVAALDGVARRTSLTEAERKQLTEVLRPALALVSHGLRVALDALDGPDPEAGAMLARDALVALGRDLARAAPRLPQR